MIVPLDSIRPDPQAARIHGGRNLAAIRDSLRQFGQQKPVVVSCEGVVIAGNGILSAAKELGWCKIAVVRSDLKAASLRAYAIADNRTGELSEWDDELLADQLHELAGKMDLESLGFSERDLHELFAGQENEEPAPPPPPRKAVSRRGTMYRLGDHRLLVDDATKAGNLSRLLAGEQADLLLTDPPYNVAYEGGTAESLRIENDSMGDDAFRAFLTDAFAAADSVMRPGAVFYIWHADTEAFNFHGACRQVAWQVRQCLVWAKNAFVLGRQPVAT